MSNITTITGLDAIDHAARHGLTLSKYNDPVEDAREGLTVEEARDVAAEDPSLIYLRVATHVVVEHMPATWRESHHGGDWGQYPANGAVRVLMTREDAEELVAADSDGYDHILRDATLSDMTRYPREPLESLRESNTTLWEYEVFDGNPATSGPCGWEVRYGECGWPDPADYDDPEELLSDVLAHAVAEAAGLPDYEAGDRLWAQVTDVESDVIVASGSEAVS